MVIIVNPANYTYHKQDLHKMYALRHKVFREKLNWDVASQEGLEKDDYDENGATYLLYKDEIGEVRACHRLIPMTENTMFDGPFSHTFPEKDLWKKPMYWECSRFAVDPDLKNGRHEKGFRYITSEMFASLMQFGQTHGVECFLTLMFFSMDKLLKKMWFVSATLNELEIDQQKAVVAAFVPSEYTFSRLEGALPQDSQRHLWCSFDLAA